MIKVKICGITTEEEALFCADAGAEAIGFVFAESPRRIDPDTARRISEALPPFMHRTGVFVNAEKEMVDHVAGFCGLTSLQFHGSEDAAFCRSFNLPVIKAIRVKSAGELQRLAEFPAAAYLLDSYHPRLFGGSGAIFDWSLAERPLSRPVILAGGLNASNVTEAVRLTRPYAVDVSSGVESGGRKDRAKIRAFIEAVRRGG
jgi:phosphoribosylanthranilate isomerase